MATSGNTQYFRTAEQLVRTALRHCGLRDSKITTTDLYTGLESLNSLILKLRVQHVMLWKIVDLTVPLVAAQASYTIAPSGANVTAPKPMKVLSVRRKELSSGYETPLNQWSIAEYTMQNVKNTTGDQPLSYMYQPLAHQGVLKIWPVPTTTTPTTFSLILSCAMPMEVMDDFTDDFDIPSEWYNALGWMVASDLMVDYDVPYNKMQQIGAKAEQAEDDVIDASQEDASVYFSADVSGAR